MTDARQKGCCKMICFTAALFAFSKPIRFAGYEPAEKVSAFFIGKMFLFVRIFYILISGLILP